MKAEILAGMDLLDWKAPGWSQSVNLDQLDQYEATWTDQDGDCGCVLVQVYDNFFDGLAELKISKRDAAKFGFAIDHITIGVTTTQDVHRNYRTLTAWWKRLFRIRYGSF